ncbi:MAG: VPLPA-CTERM sorting domain-containing protein [Deltaproteobacteria bacterium]|nr:VPLPA-CTERM sorting domain-containing protein [Deltaproteobacteria bacterium]
MMKSRLMGAVIVCVFTLITTSTNAEFIEHDSLTLTGVPLELFFPGDFIEAISFNGSAQYDVFFPFDEGSAVDGDFDGREEVATEMISLDLTGNSGTFGPVVIALNSSPASMGGLVEQVNINTGILDVPPFTLAPPSFVDSFFNIFVEITIGGNALHNNDPVFITGTWSRKPSTHNEFIAMFTDFSPVGLFDENGNPTGFFLGPGQQVIPLPTALWLFGSGLLGLIVVARRKKD